MEDKVKIEDFPKFEEPELEKAWKEIKRRDIFKHSKNWRD